MKKSYVVLIAVLALMLAFSVSAVSAQDGPASYTSGFQVQNLDSTNTANIAINFYKKDGTIEATVNDSLPAGGSKTYFPLNDVSSGFDGSVVISSDQKIAAIVNVFGDDGAFGGGSYSGFDGGASTVNIPLVIKNLSGVGTTINTFFNVQNAGGASADVTVTYPGTSCTENATVPVGSAATFDQASNTCLSDGFVGSAVVTSTGADVVASVVQYDKDSLLANNGFTGSSTNPVMPLVVNNIFNTFTGIQIQNAGTTATDVTLTYTPSPGNPGQTCTETHTINPSESANYGISYITDNCETSGTSGFVGGAAVTGNSASQGLVAIVNQVDIFGATAGNASAYAAFDPASGTQTVAIPVIVKDLAIPGGTLFTGYNIVNVGSSQTTVTCSYSGQTSAEDDVEVVDPGQAVNVVQAGSGSNLPTGYVGSAICSADSGGAIVAVVNQVGGAGDALFTFEAFNQ